MLKCPKVSVIIPMFNAQNFILETLKNLFLQTFNDFEVVIINDGSTDNSFSLVKQVDDPRIVLIEQKNSGVSVARNTAIMHARGEFVAFLDADDLWHTAKLDIQVKQLEHHPDIDFCYTDRDLFDDIEDLNLSVEVDSDSIEKQQLFPLLLKHNHIHCSSVMVRRTIFAKIGLFDVMLAASEDSDLWIRAAKSNTVLRIASVLSFYRRHDTNTINSIKFRRNRVFAELLFYARWIRNPAGRVILADNIKGNSHALAYEEESLQNHCQALRYFCLAFFFGKRDLRTFIKIISLWFKTKLTSTQ
ncbi:MAG: glycosyltransferase involved in cell wall biosynthesis [Paraglaciecola sp.]|jgi:glycosyltransferase involved in cell wall biosynthesis